MKKRLILFISTICISWNISSAQCPPPGYPGTGDNCPAAPVLCLEIDGYCGTLPNNGSQQNFPGCPGNVLNNDEWLSFAAGTTFIEFQIVPSNCVGTNGQFGMQAAVYEGSCIGTAVAIQCSCSQNPFILSFNAIVGETYFMVLDGCAGDVCDYQINVLAGSTIPVTPPAPNGIDGPTVVFNGTTTDYSISGATNNNYNWTIGPPGIGTIIGSSQSSSISVQWISTGTVQICASAFNVCGLSSNPICIGVNSENPIPDCTSLITPLNGTTNVDVDIDFEWAVPAFNPTGYRLTAGINSGGVDILNDLDVGNVTTYDPGTLPFDSPIYVTITPYNAVGDAINCIEEVFSTGNCITTSISNWIGIYHVWNQASNWDLGMVPELCTHVIIPSGIVLVPIDETAIARTLEVQLGAVLEIPMGSTMTIE